jgi:uncharacterized membrane protein YkvA (DUF1232 family)
MEHAEKYSQHYDEKRFLQKLKSTATQLGKEVVFRILILYYLLSSGKVPLKVRLLIVAALGYFVLPTDMVADFIPVLGFSDDVAFLTYAFNQASKYADKSIKEKARKKLNSLTKSHQNEQEKHLSIPEEDAPTPT